MSSGVAQASTEPANDGASVDGICKQYYSPEDAGLWGWS